MTEHLQFFENPKSKRSLLDVFVGSLVGPVFRSSVLSLFILFISQLQRTSIHITITETFFTETETFAKPFYKFATWPTKYFLSEYIENKTMLIIFGIPALLAIFILLIFIMVIFIQGWMETKNKDVALNLRKIGFIYQAVFFSFFHCIFLAILQNDTQVQETLGDSINIHLIKTIVWVFGIINVILATVFVCFCYEPLHFTHDILAKRSRTCSLMAFCTKVVPVFLLAFITNRKSNNTLSSVSAVVFELISFWALTSRLPYYKLKPIKLEGTFCYINLSIGLFNVLLIPFAKHLTLSFTVGAMLLFVPLAIKLFKNMLQRTIMESLNRDFLNLQDEDQAFINLLVLEDLIQKGSLTRKLKNENRLNSHLYYLSGLIKEHSLTCEAIRCACKLYVEKPPDAASVAPDNNEHFPANLNEENILYGELMYCLKKDLLEQATYEFPKWFLMKLNLASFIAHTKYENRVKTLLLIYYVEAKATSYVHRTKAVQIKRLIEREIKLEEETEARKANTSISIEGFIRAHSFAENLTKMMKSQTQLHFNFWDKLEESEPKLADLLFLGKKCEREFHNIRQFWKNNTQNIDPHFTKVFLMYGLFLRRIKNTHEESNQILRTTIGQYVRKKSEGKYTADQIEAANIYDESNMVVRISLQKERFAQIIAITQNVKEWFGINSEVLLNKNVNQLMPKFIKRRHNEIMRKYLNTGKSTMINTNRKVYGIHTDGFLVPMNLYVTPYPYIDQDYTIISVLRPTQNNEETILVTPDGSIQGITHIIAEKLGINNIHSLKSHNIKTYCAGFEKINNVLNYFTYILMKNNQNRVKVFERSEHVFQAKALSQSQVFANMSMENLEGKQSPVKKQDPKTLKKNQTLAKKISSRWAEASKKTTSLLKTTSRFVKKTSNIIAAIEGGERNPQDDSDSGDDSPKDKRFRGTLLNKQKSRLPTNNLTILQSASTKSLVPQDTQSQSQQTQSEEKKDIYTKARFVQKMIQQETEGVTQTETDKLITLQEEPAIVLTYQPEKPANTSIGSMPAKSNIFKNRDLPFRPSKLQVESKIDGKSSPSAASPDIISLDDILSPPQKSGKKIQQQEEVPVPVQYSPVRKPSPQTRDRGKSSAGNGGGDSPLNSRKRNISFASISNETSPQKSNSNFWRDNPRESMKQLEEELDDAPNDDEQFYFQRKQNKKNKSIVLNSLDNMYSPVVVSKSSVRESMVARKSVIAQTLLSKFARKKSQSKEDMQQEYQEIYQRIIYQGQLMEFKSFNQETNEYDTFVYFVRVHDERIYQDVLRVVTLTPVEPKIAKKGSQSPGRPASSSSSSYDVNNSQESSELSFEKGIGTNVRDYALNYRLADKFGSQMIETLADLKSGGGNDTTLRGEPVSDRVPQKPLAKPPKIIKPKAKSSYFTEDSEGPDNECERRTHLGKLYRKAAEELNLIEEMNDGMSTMTKRGQQYYDLRVEKAISSNKIGTALNFVTRIILFMFLTFGIFLGYITYSTIQSVPKTNKIIELISQTYARSIEVMEIGRISKQLRLTEYELMSIYTTAEILEALDDSTTSTLILNNAVWSQIYILSKKYKAEIYGLSIDVVDEPNQLANTGTVKRNSFDLIKDIIQNSQRLLEIPEADIDPSNTDFNAIVVYLVKNTVNGVLIPLESIPGIEETYVEDNVSFIVNVNIFILIGGVALAALTLTSLVRDERQFFIKKMKAIRIWLTVTPKDVQRIKKNISQFNKLMDNIDMDYTHGGGLSSVGKSMMFQEFGTGPKHNKKKQQQRTREGNTTGLSRKTLIHISVSSFVLIIFVLMLAILLLQNISMQNSLEDGLLNIEISYRNYYNFGLSFCALYEYISSTTGQILRQPVTTQFENLIDSLKAANRFLDNLKETDSTLSDEVNNFYVGDLCQSFFKGSSECKSIGGGVVTRGIESIQSYMISNLVASKLRYDSSNKTDEAIQEVFGYQSFVDADKIYSHYARPAYNAFVDLLKTNLQDHIKIIQGNFIMLIVIFVVVVDVILLLVWREIEKSMKRERIHIRRMLRMVPTNYVMTNKIFRGVLIRDMGVNFKLSNTQN